MIHLVDDYYVQVTATGYTSGRCELATNTAGEQFLSFVSPWHHEDMCAALYAAREAAKRERLSNMTCELKEAVIALKQVNTQFEEALTRAMGELVFQIAH